MAVLLLFKNSFSAHFFACFLYHLSHGFSMSPNNNPPFYTTMLGLIAFIDFGYHFRTEFAYPRIIGLMRRITVSMLIVCCRLVLHLISCTNFFFALFLGILQRPLKQKSRNSTPLLLAGAIFVFSGRSFNFNSPSRIAFAHFRASCI
jgi:hypothetical protein